MPFATLSRWETIKSRRRLTYVMIFSFEMTSPSVSVTLIQVCWKPTKRTSGNPLTICCLAVESYFWVRELLISLLKSETIPDDLFRSYSWNSTTNYFTAYKRRWKRERGIVIVTFIITSWEREVPKISWNI